MVAARRWALGRLMCGGLVLAVLYCSLPCLRHCYRYFHHHQGPLLTILLFTGAWG